MTSSQTVLGSERQDVELSITTKDGDTVTLSLASNYNSIYQDDKQYGKGEGVESTMYSASSQRQFNMTVEGDLDENERREIDNVIKTVDQMMNNFVNGRLKPMMAQAGKLSNMDTIGELSLKMNYTRQTVISEHTQVTGGFDPTGITYDSQGQLVTAPRSGASKAVTPEQSARSQVIDAADDLTTAMARQLARVKEVASRPYGAINQIFDKYHQQVNNLTSSNSFVPSLIDHMHKSLLDKMLNNQTNETTEAKPDKGQSITLVA